jgi:hypothetical protein
MDQPRVPAGSSKGGEFASKTGTSITEEQGATAAEYQQRGAELNSSLRFRVVDEYSIRKSSSRSS